MDRGIARLFTSWTPLGDINTNLGGLMVLENSPQLGNVKNDYGQRDVDTYYEDDPNAEE